MSDFDLLLRINVEIGKKEELGDKSYFGTLLAPQFAFMRRDHSIVGRDAFLKGLESGAARHTSVVSVSIFESRRAVVTSIVSMSDGDYHNIRLFVRPREDWKLLAWANEKVEKGDPDLRPPRPSPQDPVPI